MICPASAAAQTRGTLTLPLCAIDLDLGDHRHVGGEVLVLRKAEAAAALAVAFLARLPVGLLGDGLDHRARARILDMRQPERDRIGAGRGRQLVHEGLDREHVGIGAERAQRRHPQRHLLDEVVDDRWRGKS